MPPKEINIPPELTQAIKNDKLIIFVGAGLSWDLKNQQGEKLEGWDNLVLKILENLKEKGFDVDHFIGLVGKCEPIKILELIESDKNLSKNDIAHFIKGFVDLSEENDLSLHEKLFQLSNKIITTNYDTAFEMNIKELRKHTAYKGRNYELTLHKDSKKPLLFKLHGCYEAVDSMVLFPKQYNALYNTPAIDAEHSLSVLKNIIYNKSVLFIGCGMGDFQINYFFKKIKELQGDYNQKHFIIDTKPSDSSLDFLLRIPIGEYSEIPHVIERLLVEKEKFKHQRIPEVRRLEQQLIESGKQILNYEEQLKHITDQAERKNKLLEREASKYFRKGLEFSLNEKWEKAIKEYKTAVELKPDFLEPLNNLGIALGKLAKTKSGIEAEILYRQAIKKYQKAIDIKPDDDQAFYNLGNALGKLAKTKSGIEAEILYRQAIEKYQKAIDIKPDYHKALYNLGTRLLDLAKIKSGKEAGILYKQAIEKFQEALEIKPNKYQAIYNLACTYALLPDKKNALLYLEQTLQNKNQTTDFILQDEDWQAYLKDKDFKKLIQKYKDK